IIELPILPPWKTRHYGDVLAGVGQALYGGFDTWLQTGSQQQIFWRVTGQRQLRKQDKISAALTGGVHLAEHLIAVAGNIANQKVALRHGDVE
ncbi:hypothetical protein Q4595_17695, partial [Wenyingzhuangia sp. 1_MG-2023]|nr:hypothetical protein [Wenyingzhuangia sp. 1_MG-2023]